MQHIKSVTIEFSFRIHLWLILSLVFLAFCDPNLVSGAEKYYYYLHISSFRSKTRAVQDVERLQNKGYNAISRYEQVAELGYWYRVYVGPFSSLQEAKLKKKELGRRKLVEYAAIYKKESLILSDLEEIHKIEEKRTRIETKKEAPKVSPFQVLAPTVPKKAVEVPTTHEELPGGKEVPAPIPSIEERKAERQPPPITPAKPTAKIIAKPGQITLGSPQEERGRNICRGKFGLDARHTYRKVQLELTKRKRITSDGTTSTIEDVSGTSWEKADFSTRLHMDSLHVRFGLSKYLEVFAEIGGVYRTPSDLGLAYGGGLRLNLFQVKEGRLRGFYGGLQGEYLGGEVEFEYSSSAGNKWKREAEWEELVAKGELGVARSRFATYIGAVLLHYREDTEREQLEGLPSSLTSFVFQDDLKAEESLGVYGGVIARLTPAVFLNIEGQVVSQKSIFGALEYHF